MAKVIDVPGQGLVEFPDSMSDEQIVAAIQKVSAPQQTTPMQDFTRGAGLAARGAAPVAAGAGAGFLAGGPIGAVAGGLALPLAEMATQGANVVLPKGMQIPSPSGAVEGLLTKLGFPVAQNTSERAIQAAGGALTGAAGQLTALPSIAKTAATEFGRGMAGTLAQQPGRQLAAAAPAAMAAQTAGESYGPVAGQLAGAAVGAPFGVGVKVPGGVSREQLAVQSNAAFRRAEESGIALNPFRFNKQMGDISVDLRNEGYTPTGYPKVEAAIKELTLNPRPKDFVELQALRKIITNAQASIDPAEKRIATILKDKFDDYVLNAPAKDVMSGDAKGGAEAWKQARGEYSKLMKGEVFEKMLENAQLDVSKFTASGSENSLAQQLRQLAKNDKQMRLFTAGERDAIKAAAKGGNTQNLLKFFGRFAPTGPVSGAFSGGAAMYEPTIGLPIAAGATLSRIAATKMRKGSVEDLANMMRSGVMTKPPASPYPAITATRGLLSPQISSEELQQIYGGQ